jgi:hypothetical protein
MDPRYAMWLIMSTDLDFYNIEIMRHLKQIRARMIQIDKCSQRRKEILIDIASFENEIQKHTSSTKYIEQCHKSINRNKKMIIACQKQTEKHDRHICMEEAGLHNSEQWVEYLVGHLYVAY